MKKTININLGGYFFNIDQDAFKKLDNYLKAVARSLSDDSQVKDEIISDIEARISEILFKKNPDLRVVVNDNDIDQVIKIMGKPENYNQGYNDYIDNSSESTNKKVISKKLFRDGDDKFLSGVCSGIGHYIGVDTLLIRIFFLVFLVLGLSPFIYIILWIIIPEAKTTVEKLQMEGKQANINNIEKKIRKEFEDIEENSYNLSDKVSKNNNEKIINNIKSFFQTIIKNISSKVLIIFKFFGKIVGVILFFISGFVLISIFFGLLSLSFTYIFIDDNLLFFINNSILPSWLLIILYFLFVTILFFALFILSLRILSQKTKLLSINSILILLGVWLISLFGVILNIIENNY